MTEVTEALDRPAVAAPEVVPDDVRKIRRLAALVLSVVAVWGAVLSWESLFKAAQRRFPDEALGVPLAAGFPLLLDALILGSSLMFMAGAKLGRGNAGWRLTAHVAVAGTLVMNALASPDLSGVPWHVVAPAVWSVLVELTARELIGDHKATKAGQSDESGGSDRIPLRLWLAAPRESYRTTLQALRRSALAQHRMVAGQHAAAVEAVRVATGKPVSARRVRGIVRRQLAAGSLPARDVLAAVGWVGDGDLSKAIERNPEALLRAVLAITARDVTARPARPASRVSQGPKVSSPPEGPATTAETPPQVGTAGPRPELPAVPAAPARPRTRKRTTEPAPVPAPAVPVSKAAIVWAALDETGGDVKAARELLAERGTPVARGYAFDVAKDWRTGQGTGPDQAGPQSDERTGPDSGTGPDRTVGPDRTGLSDRTAERTGPDFGPDSEPDSDRTTGPDRTGLPDRTPDRIDLTGPDSEGTGPDSAELPVRLAAVR